MGDLDLAGLNGGSPRRTLDVLPALDGLDVVELGCGTAYAAPLGRRHHADAVAT
jgi:hypothetical protein